MGVENAVQRRAVHVHNALHPLKQHPARPVSSHPPVPTDATAAMSSRTHLCLLGHVWQCCHCCCHRASLVDGNGDVHRAPHLAVDLMVMMMLMMMTVMVAMELFVCSFVGCGKVLWCMCVCVCVWVYTCVCVCV